MPDSSVRKYYIILQRSEDDAVNGLTHGAPCVAKRIIPCPSYYTICKLAALPFADNAKVKKK
jgi:hypothetical protein